MFGLPGPLDLTKSRRIDESRVEHAQVKIRKLVVLEGQGASAFGDPHAAHANRTVPPLAC
jgi:hypothetical protein